MSITLHKDFRLKTASLSYAEIRRLLRSWADIPGTSVECLVLTVEFSNRVVYISKMSLHKRPLVELF